MTVRPQQPALPEGVGPALLRELDAARARVDELVERRHVLERELASLAAAERERRRALEALTAVARAAAGSDTEYPNGEPHGDETARSLAGSELREVITRVALRRNAHGDAVHWRVWFGWLRADGFDAAGKRAEATFQTQLARSPLVRRSDRDGVYVLDVKRLAELRDELIALHQRLDNLPAAGQLTLIGDAREARRALLQQIDRSERRLEEAWQTLTDELGGDRDLDADDVARIWLHRRARRPLPHTTPNSAANGPNADQ